jgi:hypothetical protein
LIGPGHTGTGRFSHYDDTLVFSASDNTDPNFNGHEYAVVVPPHWANEVDLDCCACPGGKRLNLHGPYTHAEGNAFKAWVPELENIGDTSGSSTRSSALLCEDDRLVGPAHSAFHDIAKFGMGRFSHYECWMIFSPSNNTDPNLNGKKYEIVIPAKSIR